jgi:hypothetical protein
MTKKPNCQNEQLSACQLAALKACMFCIVAVIAGVGYWLDGGSPGLIIVVALLAGCGALAAVEVARIAKWI